MVLDGEGGLLPLSMHVHIFRTKMPSPDREGPYFSEINMNFSEACGWRSGLKITVERREKLNNLLLQIVNAGS